MGELRFLNVAPSSETSKELSVVCVVIVSVHIRVQPISSGYTVSMPVPRDVDEYDIAAGADSQHKCQQMRLPPFW
jgi:hypothetical protein